MGKKIGAACNTAVTVALLLLLAYALQQLADTPDAQRAIDIITYSGHVKPCR